MMFLARKNPYIYIFPPRNIVIVGKHTLVRTLEFVLTMYSLQTTILKIFEEKEVMQF